MPLWPGGKAGRRGPPMPAIVLLYRDAGHLSDRGAVLVSVAFEPVMTQLHQQDAAARCRRERRYPDRDSTARASSHCRSIVTRASPERLEIEMKSPRHGGGMSLRIRALQQVATLSGRTCNPTLEI